MTNPLDRFWPEREKAVLVIIDVQQRLVPSMSPDVYAGVRATIDMLARGAGELSLPILTTEQYPQGLGTTVSELQDYQGTEVVEKVSFGCCGEPRFLQRLRELGRSQVIVVGMEAHVCVYQTVLGLLENGYQVHLVRDAICSRHKSDYLNALDLAAAAGAVVTNAETVLFQLLRTSVATEFKAVSALVKQRKR